MTSLPKLCFATAAIFALIGMLWGIHMSATGDHLLSPAHGHLNLIGFVALSIFGTYYALTPAAAKSRLGMVHYVLTVVTVLMMAPGIVLAITDKGAFLAQISSVLGVATMGLFLFIILRHGVGASK